MRNKLQDIIYRQAELVDGFDHLLHKVKTMSNLELLELYTEMIVVEHEEDCKMKDQHTKISGYRDLTQQEIDLMNRIKAFGPELEKLCSDLLEYHTTQVENAFTTHNDNECDRIDRADPYYWLYEGRSSFQKGLMYLTRSVAQPTTF